MSAKPISLRRPTPPERPIDRPDRRELRATLGLALLVAGAAALAYAIVAHPDWLVDPLHYAVLTQRGHASGLFGPQHVLGNLLPFATYQGAKAAGYGGGALVIQSAFAVAAGAAGVGLSFLAARRLGATTAASLVAAAGLGITAAMWRAGGSAGVYGAAFAAVALAWFATSLYVRLRSTARAGLLGFAAGVAVAAHLANLAFVPAALLLVAALGAPDDASWNARLKRLAVFGSTAVATAGIAFVGAAILSNGLSVAGVREWFAHPGIGGAQGRFNAVGWGGAGLVTAVTGQPQSTGGVAPTPVALALTAAVVGIAGIRGLVALVRPGLRRLVAAALILNAALAFVEASWRQALRADYWAIGFVPLAVLGAVGGPVLPARVGRLLTVRVAALVAALALLVGVAASSLRTEVLPSLFDSRRQGRAVAAIERRLPARASVIITSPLSGRLATLGFEASTAWGVLAREVARGSPKPGLDGLLRGTERRPLFVSRFGFRLQKQQAEFLGATPRQIWNSLGRCARREPVLSYRGPAGPETLYKVGGPITLPCRINP